MATQLSRTPESLAKCLALTENVTKLVRQELIESLKPSLRDWMADAQTGDVQDETKPGISLQQLIAHSGEFDHPSIDDYLLEDVASTLVSDGEWLRHGPGSHKYNWRRNPEYAESHAALS